MLNNPKLGPNDEEPDDYRDFDDEHSQRGSKLDDFGVDEDEEDMEEVPPAGQLPVAADAPVPAATSESVKARSSVRISVRLPLTRNRCSRSTGSARVSTTSRSGAG